jgi:NADP-dependent 3-hydroxy acid dehydrogenase YdfG
MAESTNNLKDATVVITGAARGLGAALTVTLADLGCNVILCGHSLTALEIMASQIEKRTGRKPQSFVLDLAKPASIEAATKEITNKLPIIDVLINNGAAWLGRRETPYEADEVMAAINSALTGTFLFTQALMPTLQKSTRPDVVTIGSVSGLPNANLHNVSVPFYVAKHGQSALADGLRQMFLATPIRSICIHPLWLKDISPLDAEWDAAPSLAKGAMVTNRDIVEAVIYAITRPRHVTIASMVIDSDIRGTDFRSHLKE